MMESFIAVREIMSFYHNKKFPAIMYKVDFEKAFDIVDWCFMISLLIERGFLPRWLSAIMELLRTSKSAVMDMISIILSLRQWLSPRELLA